MALTVYSAGGGGNAGGVAGAAGAAPPGAPPGRPPPAPPASPGRAAAAGAGVLHLAIRSLYPGSCVACGLAPGGNSGPCASSVAPLSSAPHKPMTTCRFIGSSRGRTLPGPRWFRQTASVLRDGCVDAAPQVQRAEFV